MSKTKVIAPVSSIGKVIGTLITRVSQKFRVLALLVRVIVTFVLLIMAL
jgi:hypothetical protein